MLIPASRWTTRSSPPQAPAHGGVEAREGLVEQQQPRFSRERPGERDAAPLPPRQLLRVALLESPQAEPVDPPCGQRRAGAGAEGDLLPDAAPRHQRRRLRHVADVAPLGRAARCRSPAAEPHLPPRSARARPGQQSQREGLARARRARAAPGAGCRRRGRRSSSKLAGARPQREAAAARPRGLRARAGRAAGSRARVLRCAGRRSATTSSTTSAAPSASSDRQHRRGHTRRVELHEREDRQRVRVVGDDHGGAELAEGAQPGRAAGPPRCPAHARPARRRARSAPGARWPSVAATSSSAGSSAAKAARAADHQERRRDERLREHDPGPRFGQAARRTVARRRCADRARTAAAGRSSAAAARAAAPRAPSSARARGRRARARAGRRAGHRAARSPPSRSVAVSSEVASAEPTPGREETPWRRRTRNATQRRQQVQRQQPAQPRAAGCRLPAQFLSLRRGVAAAPAARRRAAPENWGLTGASPLRLSVLARDELSRYRTNAAAPGRVGGVREDRHGVERVLVRRRQRDRRESGLNRPPRRRRSRRRAGRTAGARPAPSRGTPGRS